MVVEFQLVARIQQLEPCFFLKNVFNKYFATTSCVFVFLAHHDTSWWAYLITLVVVRPLVRYSVSPSRRPSVNNFLFHSYLKNYYSYQVHISHMVSPYGLVVHLGNFISFAYSIWPPGGHL